MRRVLLHKRSSLALLGLSLFFFVFSSFFLSPIRAQEGGIGDGEVVTTNPKIRNGQVTATVTDNIPPTTPILIAPENGALLTDNTPTFVWESGYDDLGVSHYELSLNGSVYYGSIPTGNASNSQFTVTYDSDTDSHSLTPTVAIPDGTYTWKITVWDVNDNSTDSVTWTFTIDSTAPSFIITQVGTETTAISAQDVSTVPTSPLVLTANEPLILATGEANSTVQVTLIIPGSTTQNYTIDIASNGSWELQLGILPRGVVMTMNFLITDEAGNLSVLNGVEFMIEEIIIVFPPASPSPQVTPTPSPSPVDPSASPDPFVTPTPGATPPTPSSPAPSPLFSITIIPPRELFFTFIRDSLEDLPIPVQNFLESLQPLVEQLAPISALLVALSIPIISTAAVATQFGGTLSPTLLMKILQALGLIPVGKPQGMVFNSQTDEGVPFAILTFRNRDGEEDLSIVETVVSNMDGVYQGITLPAGTYQIEVRQQDYHFPTKIKRPRHLGMGDFYRGEVFSLGEKEEPLFLIPMDPLIDTNEHRWIIRARLVMARLSRQSAVALFPLALLSAILVTLYPTIWNFIVFGLYVLFIARRVILWFRVPIITGQVIDERGQPLSRVIVRLSTVGENALAAVLLTDSNGEFKYYGDPDLYQLSLQKTNYVWMEGTAAQSFYQVDVRTAPEHVVANLTPLSAVYSDLIK